MHYQFSPIVLVQLFLNYLRKILILTAVKPRYVNMFRFCCFVLVTEDKVQVLLLSLAKTIKPGRLKVKAELRVCEYLFILIPFFVEEFLECLKV